MDGDAEQFVSETAEVESAESVRAGGYLHVYRGRLADVAGTVRILALAPDIDDDAVRGAFTRTVQDWQTVSTQPNVATVYDSGRAPRPWVATEWVDGRPLSEAEFTLSDARQAIDGLAEALRVTDLYNARPPMLTPGSVSLVWTADGASAVVNDWGLERACRVAAGKSPVSPYTPPEQVDGGPRTEQGGVYAFAAVSYVLLTGHPPPDWGGQRREQAKTDVVDPPSEYDQDLSTDVDDIVLRGLAPDPADRPESAREFKQQLLAALPGSARASGRELTGRDVGSSPVDSRPDADTAGTATSSGRGGRLELAVVGLALLLGVSLAGAVVVVEPFTTGGEAIEVTSAELRGADGIVVEGDLSGVDADTRFTVRVRPVGDSSGDPLLTLAEVTPAERTGQQFRLAVDAETIDTQAPGFEFVGDSRYEVAVETAEGGESAVATLDRGDLRIELERAEYRTGEATIGVTGSLTQGGAPVTDDSVSIGVRLSRDGEEATLETSGDTSEGNRSLLFTVADEDTQMEIAAGGNVTVTATYGSTADTVVAEIPSARFDIGSLTADTPADEGESLELAVGVTNTGEAAGTRTVEVDAGGLGSELLNVSLPGGQSTTETVILGTDTGDAGEYTATASTPADQESTAVQVQAVEPAAFSVELTGTSGPVTAGETVEVSAQVTNTGERGDTQTVALDLSALGSDTASVSLAGGESTTRSFIVETPADSRGEHVAVVSSQDDQDSVSVTVQRLEPASFAVEILGTNGPVTAGGSVEVTAEISNTGDESGTQTVEVDAGEIGLSTTEVTLAGGESATRTLGVETAQDESGTYPVAVASEDDTASVTVSVETPDGPLFLVDIGATNAPIVEGEVLRVNITVTNLGDGFATEPVSLTTSPDIGGTSASARLSGGANASATIAVVSTGQGDAGQYTLTVATEDDSESTTVTVLQGRNSRRLAARVR